MNKLEIIGNLTADPTMRQTSTQKDVASFTVAVNRGSGENKTTQFFQVSAFSRRAELCMQYLRKGSKVYIRGEATSHAWVDQTGTPRSSINIIADEIEFLSSRQGDGAQEPGGGAPAGTGSEPQFTQVEAEELPF